MINDLNKSQKSTIFYEEVELLRAKIENALYENQNQEHLFLEFKQQLLQQKDLLPSFITTGEAEKGEYLNFNVLSKAIQSKYSQEAFIIHGQSEKRSHAMAIVQNSLTGRFYFYDCTGIPLFDGTRIYAFNSAIELQEAVLSYVSSHYSELANSNSKWRLQQLDLK
jgi:hypothetical protein